MSDETRDLVERALAEDAPAGDLTGDLTVGREDRCTAELRSKAEGVLAGARVADLLFAIAAEQDGMGAVRVAWRSTDGHAVRPGDVVAVIEGPARTILRAERVAINFLSHLSGVATL